MSPCGVQHRGKMALSKLKAILRAAAPRTVNDLWQAIADALPRFTAQECQNYFKAAGYAGSVIGKCSRRDRGPPLTISLAPLSRAKQAISRVTCKAANLRGRRRRGRATARARHPTAAAGGASVASPHASTSSHATTSTPSLLPLSGSGRGLSPEPSRTRRRDRPLHLSGLSFRSE